ncbi:MAG: hypothetical protein VX976_00165 [Pseudomonadota bacterium]|nr:hypothetical protein [Pseudomonadota bacterium]
MRLVIIATEPSGDYLGFQLIKSLKKKKKIEIKGVGGELMESLGFNSWVPMSNFNAIGIYEVIIRIFKFLKLFNIIIKSIRDFNPQLIITIDSPSFNYRLVKKIQDLRKNTKFVHYVAPSVWAWKPYRAKIFSRLYDKIFTLFNFEPPYFTKYGLKAEFIGHQTFYGNYTKLKKKKIILFLPGSRVVEIRNNMKKMKNIISKGINEFKDFRFYILTFKRNEKLIRNFVNNSNVFIESDFKKKQQLMSQSFLAVTASGSVTLELIKYKTPMVVVYNTHFITRILIKSMVKVKFASLINIVCKKEVVPEFLFEKFSCSNVINEMKKLVNKGEIRKKQIVNFKKFSDMMLVKGQNPADLIVQKLKI